MKNRGLGLSALALALAAGACGVDYTSLGDRPEGSGAGGAGGGAGSAGGGAGGGAAQCAGPNPAGCGESAPCQQGAACVEVGSSTCAPSSCQCAESGEWSCTKDCVAARACVAPPASAARLSYACAPNDAGLVFLVIGLGERSCSSALAYPLLLLPFQALGYSGEFPAVPTPSIDVGRAYEFTKAELEEVQFFDVVVGSLEPFASEPPVVLERGSVTVNSWDGGALMTGSYEVELAGGARLTGTFDADLCQENVATCG